jgi:hypothetical protein
MKTELEENGNKHYQIQSALNFFVNASLICYCCFQVLEFCHILRYLLEINYDFVPYFGDEKEPVGILMVQVLAFISA